MPVKVIQNVLFDLDGTFADTAPDLAHALNQTLKAHQLTELTLEQIRPVVSHGGKALIELGFQIDEHDPQFEPLRLELLGYYQQDIARHTRLFDGIATLLDHLQQVEIPWGIVTNKPGWLTDPLMEELELTHQACCIISGDTLAERKPHPAPLLHAAKLCAVAPEHCLYIGDAERDIIAGKRANMHTMVARYGYINHGDDPDSWQADSYIEHPAEAFEWICSMNHDLQETKTHVR